MIPRIAKLQNYKKAETMLITKLLEEMMGSDSEFQSQTLYLPVWVIDEATDLAAQIGVPTNRLLAELLPPALKEARTEWRMINCGLQDDSERAMDSSPKFSIQPRIKG